MIALGLATGYYISKTVFVFELAFVALNVAYSWSLKRIPYIEFFAYTGTHLLRWIFGMVLGGGVVYTSLLIGGYIWMSGFSLVKREHEMIKKGRIKSRPVLKYYTRERIKIMYFAGVFMLMICTYFADGISQLILGILLIFYIITLPIIRKKLKNLEEQLA